MKLTIINFDGQAGKLVKRSAHYQQQQCRTGAAQLGIISELRVLPDDAKQPIVWPVVMWEGDWMPRATHPVNVEYVRRHDQKSATYKEMTE